MCVAGCLRKDGESEALKQARTLPSEIGGASSGQSLGKPLSAPTQPGSAGYA